MKKQIILTIFLIIIVIHNITILSKTTFSPLSSNIDLLIFSLINYFLLFSVLILVITTAFVIWSKSKFTKKVNLINISICLPILFGQFLLILGYLITFNLDFGYDPLSIIGLFIINLILSNSLYSKSYVQNEINKHCNNCNYIAKKTDNFCRKCGFKL